MMKRGALSIARAHNVRDDPHFFLGQLRQEKKRETGLMGEVGRIAQGAP